MSIERGGSVTLHNPGQLVGYPIVFLEPGQRNVVRFVRELEAQLMQALQSLGIKTTTRKGLTGLWLGLSPDRPTWKKTAAIGLAVKQWVTYHGFSINVTNDLSPYQTIQPCGLSIEELGKLSEDFPNLTLGQVKQEIIETFKTTQKASALSGSLLA